MNICHPYFERTLIDDTYATRIDKGTYAALDKAFSNMKRYDYCAKLDVRKYFNSISHCVLKHFLRTLFKDLRLLDIFDRIIDSYPDGVPIGNLTSQYFANFYLSGLDHYIKETLRIPVYIRYMDDMLLLENDKLKLKAAVSSIESYLTDRLFLKLKPAVFGRTAAGVSFLGYRLYPHKILLNKRSKKRFYRKQKQFSRWLSAGDYTYNEIRSCFKVTFAFEHHACVKHLLNQILTK
jgi:hypothetical protein